MFIIYESQEFKLNADILDDLTQHGVKVVDGPYVGYGSDRTRVMIVLIQYHQVYGELRIKVKEPKGEIFMACYYINKENRVGYLAGNIFLNLDNLGSLTIVPKFNHIWDDVIPNKSNIPNDFKKWTTPEDMKKMKSYFKDLVEPARRIELSDYE